MADLEYLELHLMNSCNLNCKGCSHFSNIAKDDDVESPEEFEVNMKRLAELVPVIYKIRLLGGEPFLNPRLPEYLKIVRKYYPYTDIRLVTNGLLIPGISDNVLQAVKDHQIMIDISMYKPTIKNIQKIKEKLDEFHIRYETTQEITEFIKRMSFEGDADIEEAFRNCNSKQCHFYHKGKVSACPAPYVITHFHRHFDMESSISEKDEMSIFEPRLTNEAIVAFLNSPLDMCRYCKKPVAFPWECGKKPEISDWVI